MFARWRHLRDNWTLLSYYEHFESTVALILTLVIALIVMVALYRLGKSVIAGLLLGALDPDFRASLRPPWGDARNRYHCARTRKIPPCPRPKLSARCN